MDREEDVRKTENEVPEEIEEEACHHPHHHHHDDDDEDEDEPHFELGCSCGHCHHEHHEHGHEHGHEHHHGHGHRHGADADGEDDEAHEKKEKRELILGAGLFAAAVILHLVLREEGYSWPLIVLLVASYLILGKDVLLTSVRNIVHGEIFDENFLMSIATLGAFAIREYPEAVGVMLFFRLGEMFEDMAVESSRKKILETVNLRAETVTLSNGSVIPAKKAKAGDLILVSPGDRVPLDGVITGGESFLDTSAITGEPVLVRVGPGSEILAGCVNTQGVLTVRATKKLSESMTSRILRSVEEAQEQKPQIEHFITRFARVYTPIVVGLALFVAVAMPLIRGEAFKPWLYTAISFLVMSCPCALVVSVPLAFFCGIGTASGRGILLKGGAAIEALSRIKAVVLDKTGTITEGSFAVQTTETLGTLSEEEALRLAAACERLSRHPIGQSIVNAALSRGLEIPEAEDMSEIAGRGVIASVEGRRILCGNPKLLMAEGVSVEGIPAAAGTQVLLAVDGILQASLTIADAVKKDAQPSLSALKKMGLTPVMLTGDGEASAREIAGQVGIGRIRAGLLPEEKLSAMQEIRREIGGVLFVGDGLNDAPVLAGADVGAAMGSGADAAIEAADLVFMNSNVAAIPEAITLANRAMRIARENVIGALAIKILVMILGVAGIYSNMWLAVFADTGVLFLCILNALRLLRWKTVK
ncbi:MAG: cadmium-translocating P-type ATPase [Lachnospiraceae bacterium]|nr:cadmium-translocating P-type ATPase [Lachnospiraceae bacterium]